MRLRFLATVFTLGGVLAVLPALAQQRFLQSISLSFDSSLFQNALISR